MSARVQPLPAFGPLGTTRTTVNGVSFDMVKLPPGRFVDGEGAGRRELLVSRPFEIGLTLVTQALWAAVMGTELGVQTYDLPVNYVSWDGTQGFLARLQDLGLPGFRLSTEAEWAWAARCGAPTRWPGADRASVVAAIKENGRVPVADLSPAAAGIMELSGNVSEWQQDRIDYSPLLPGVDPKGSTSGKYRIYRGGSWFFSSLFARINYRNDRTANFSESTTGFRLLRASS
jgi:formylglycine-generating enzyme required for sulfatase activity